MPVLIHETGHLTTLNTHCVIAINQLQVPKTASLVVFSFTQGDAESFDQKINLKNLALRSAVDPSRTIASRHPFSLMETPFDATVQPNVALQTRSLAGTQQWLLGKP
jgi:hypothetical protein